MSAIPLSKPREVTKLIGVHVDEPLRQLVGESDWNKWSTETTMEKVRKMKGDKLPYWLQGYADAAGRYAVTNAPQKAISQGGVALGVAISSNAMHMGFGLGSAAAPWMTALMIYRDYSGVVNKNNLHDVAPQSSSVQSKFRCDCAKDKDGQTECDNAISWLIDRSECDLCVTAVSFMLAGLPSVSQFAYRKIRKLTKKSRVSALNGKAYIAPGASAVWKPDAQNCTACNSRISSRLTTGADRHHCRVCGENFCGDCCSIRTQILNPLRKGGFEPGVKPNQLICNACIVEAKEQGKQAYRYEDGPHRRATTLKKNALAKSSAEGGCPRALAALYAICNGCTTSMFWALVARDGNDDLVRRLKM